MPKIDVHESTRRRLSGALAAGLAPQGSVSTDLQTDGYGFLSNRRKIQVLVEEAAALITWAAGNEKGVKWWRRQPRNTEV